MTKEIVRALDAITQQMMIANKLKLIEVELVINELDNKSRFRKTLNGIKKNIRMG